MNSPCYNWDRSSWLSSKEYFQELSNQLIDFLDITEEKKILDVGCGRGHLLETLALNINLINQPVGVEPVKHDDFIPQNVGKRTHLKSFTDFINFFCLRKISRNHFEIQLKVSHVNTIE